MPCLPYPNIESILSTEHRSLITQFRLDILPFLQNEALKSSLPETTHKRTLFVAIRGTAPVVDWLINFNGDDVDADFLVRKITGPSNSPIVD